MLINNNMTLEEALQGKEIPQEIVETLTIVTVCYRTFNDQTQEGQIVVHGEVADEVVNIFKDLLALNFPIHTIIPVSAYEWDDEISMEANNSSAFNYRKVAGTDVMSAHALGLAIDINPRQNPFINGGVVVPKEAIYNPNVPGTFVDGAPAVRAFTDRGWLWGGHYWKNSEEPLDYHHFEKKLL